MSLNHDENRIKRSSDIRGRRSGRSSDGARYKNSSKNRSAKRVDYGEKELSAFDSFITDEDKFFDSYMRPDKKVSQPKSSSGKKQSMPSKRKDDIAVAPAKIRELTAKQRRFRTMVMYAIMFVVIVAAALILSFTILFKTNNIEVEGEIPYTAEEIIEVSGLYKGENIFLSRKKAAAKKIVEAFPYIESAEVSFKIPGTQVIKVEGAIPSYEISINGGYVVVSSKGRVLAHNTERTRTIPLLKGVRVKDTEVGEYIKFEKSATQQILADIINSINENNIPSIYGIDISNAANIKLNYDNRITISLGVPEDIGYKLRTALAIINNELAESDKGDLDVSLSNSDRKVSYFKPIYSNTVTIDEVQGSDTDKSSDSDDKLSSSKIE